jgi:hypothetical protein
MKPVIGHRSSGELLLRLDQRSGQLRELSLGVELDLLEPIGERAEVGRSGGGRRPGLQVYYTSVLG